MPQDKFLARMSTDGGAIVQVREEPRWPFPLATDLGEEQVIAGILKEPGKERLSIRQAMHRGLVTHGTGLALLEHQAASGYIVDIAQGRMLSVRDARNAGLIDREHLSTLLIAEKAVTGYTDPYSGNKLCLFQAMRKGLLIKEHGIRLLEAQVATGGLIHPRHSHRLPVDVAYQWGYLDAEIFHRISDPARHTRRCFDTNARENLTYLQLLPRCVLDPGNGLLMFQVIDKGSVHLHEDLRQALKSAFTKVSMGIFQDQDVSLWDLLFSRYVTWHKRQELLRQFKAGTLTLQGISQILTETATDREPHSCPCRGEEPRPVQEMAVLQGEGEKSHSGWEEVEKVLRSRKVHNLGGEFHGQKVSIWDLLYSKSIPKGRRKELLKLYRMGVLTLDQMETAVRAIVAQTEEEKAGAIGQASWATREDQDLQEAQLRHSLEMVQVLMSSGEFKGQRVSVWDLLCSKRFPHNKRQELLELYRTGALSPGQMAAAARGTLEKVEAGRKKFSVRVRGPGRGRGRGVPGSEEAEAAGTSCSKMADDLLKATLVTLPAGEPQGQELSAWDLLASKYIARDKAEEILAKYREGKFTVQEVSSILTILASLHDLFCSLEQMTPRSQGNPTSQDLSGPPATSCEKGEEEEEEDDDDDDDDDDDSDEGDSEKDKVLKSRMVTVPVGEFRGRKVSVWDLLHSNYFPEKKRKEILKLYRIGILTADQTETVVTTIVTKLGEQIAQSGHQGSEETPKGGGGRTREESTFEFPVGEFQGRRVSVWDLLFSSSISESTRQELLMKYASGALSIQKMGDILTALIVEGHKWGSTPNIPHVFTTGFGPSQAPWASLHDLLRAQEPEALKPGRVTVSEITVTTTTVVQGPEETQG